MANTIKIKRSAVPAKAPTTGDLALGELALNTYDGKLYTKKDNGTASIVELSAVPDGDKGDITVSASGATWTIDSGVVTSAKITDLTIVDGDISATAGIAVSKLADGAPSQLLQTNSAGTGVEWTNNVDIPGTLDVTGLATFDGRIAAGALSGVAPAIGTPSSVLVGFGDYNDTATATSGTVAHAANCTINDQDFSATNTSVTYTNASTLYINGQPNASTNVTITNAYSLYINRGTSFFGGKISFPLGTAALPSIYPGADTNTGFWSPAEDTLAVSTNGVERYRCTSAGLVGIGTLAPYELLHVQGVTPAAVIRTSNAVGNALLKFNADDVNFARIGIENTALVMRCSNSATPTEAMRINSQQEVLIGTTTRNANGGVLQLKSGITFPATQVAATDANTLDDYEEGTFTPVIQGTTLAGTGTYTSQVGRYTKVGNVVNFFIGVTWTAHTGTGNMQISGLPFTASIDNEMVPSITYANLASPASTFVQLDIDNGSTNVRFYSCVIATGVRALLAIDTAATVYITGAYRV